MKISAGTIARTIVLALAILNQILVSFDINTIPIADEELTEFLSLAVTIGSAAVAWWKNNSFTKAAIEADVIKNTLKSGKQ